jgi:hypothetical protein
MILYQIIELTPDQTEEDGELIHYDAERVVLTYDTREDAQKVLDVMLSVNSDWSVYEIKEITITPFNPQN